MGLDFSEEEVREFRTEATDMLNAAEQELLKLETGAKFLEHYDSIFRVFHSLKGGASMFGMDPVKDHMHQLENFFTTCKPRGAIEKDQVSFFLKGVDAARKILNAENVQFDYVLPQAKSPEVKLAASPHKASVAKSISAVPSSGLVYLVDDEPELLEILKELLQNGHFECKCFEDPKSLLAEINTRIPDLVLTDMSMPEMTGMDILKQIKKNHPDLPVIFISGYLTKDNLIEAMGHGLFAAIEKPFEEKAVITYCLIAAKQSITMKLVNRSINLMLYQFQELDQFLKEKGKEEIRTTVRSELDQLMAHRRLLRTLRRT